MRGRMRGLAATVGALFVLTAAGCLSLRSGSEEVHTYQLNLDGSSSEAHPGKALTGPVLLVSEPQAEPGFETQGMVYLKRPYELEYYAVNQCSGVQPMVYTWSWGDGSTSTGANPSHTYAASGYYTICVSITDATGCTSTYCDSSNYLMRTDAMVTVNVVGGMNGIQNISELSDVNLYPNPANESVTVSFNSNGNSTVSLLDYTGRTILSKNITGASKNFSESFSVSSVADGLYFIKVECGNTSKLLKLQVNH